MGTAYLTSYATSPTGMQLNRVEVLSTGMVASVFVAAATLASGILSDRFGRKKVIATSCILAVPWSLALFPILSANTVFAFAVGLTVTLVIFAIAYGPAGALLPELFETRYRYTGAGMGYNLAGVVGGGIVPLVAAQLAGTSGAWSVGFLLAGIGVFSVLCTLALPNREKQGLEGGDAGRVRRPQTAQESPSPPPGTRGLRGNQGILVAGDPAIGGAGLPVKTGNPALRDESQPAGRGHGLEPVVRGQFGHRVLQIALDGHGFQPEAFRGFLVRTAERHLRQHIEFTAGQPGRRMDAVGGRRRQMAADDIQLPRQVGIGHRAGQGPQLGVGLPDVLQPAPVHGPGQARPVAVSMIETRRSTSSRTRSSPAISAAASIASHTAFSPSGALSRLAMYSTARDWPWTTTGTAAIDVSRSRRTARSYSWVIPSEAM